MRFHPVLTMDDLRLPVAAVFQDTGLMGIVSLLISLLMNHRPQRKSEALVLTPNLRSISCLAIRLLNNVARLDVSLMQATLGSSNQLEQEFIHMVSYFLESLIPKLPDISSFKCTQPGTASGG